MGYLHDGQHGYCKQRQGLVDLLQSRCERSVDGLDILTETVQHATLRGHVVPSHRRPNDGPQKFLKQDPRRSERTGVLCDDAENIDDTSGQGDRGIDADVEVRVFLCRWEGNLQRSVWNSRGVHHRGVVEVR